MAIYLNHLGLVCSIGHGQRAVREALFRTDAPQGMTLTEAYSPGRVLPLGEVTSPLPDSSAWPLHHRSRTNALLSAALQEIRAEVDAAVARVGPSRVAIVLGGSTSGVREGEAAVRSRRSSGEWPASYHYRQQELGSGALTSSPSSSASPGPRSRSPPPARRAPRLIASGARLLRRAWPTRWSPAAPTRCAASPWPASPRSRRCQPGAQQPVVGASRRHQHRRGRSAVRHDARARPGAAGRLGRGVGRVTTCPAPDPERPRRADRDRGGAGPRRQPGGPTDRLRQPARHRHPAE